jgi:hypothetical protein
MARIRGELVVGAYRGPGGLLRRPPAMGEASAASDGTMSAQAGELVSRALGLDSDILMIEGFVSVSP